MRRSRTVNVLLPLLHALVVVIAIGAAMAATSPRAAVIQPAPSTSKYGLDSTQIKVVAGEGHSGHSHANGDMVGSMGNGGDKRSSDREAGKNHKELCGSTTTNTTTAASGQRSTHSQFCSVDSSIRSTRNLRGSRTEVIHSTDSSRHQRNNGKVVESAVKSPNNDGKKRKRFLRWAGDDNQETIKDSNNSSSMEEARRNMGATALAVGTVTDSHLRTSREGVVLVDAVGATAGDMDRSGGLAGESRKSAGIDQGVDLSQSLRRRRA